MRAYVTRRARIHKTESGYEVSEEGRLQSELLANQFVQTQQPIDVIYSGTSSRHRQTATILADTFDVLTGERPSVRDREGLDDLPWPRDAFQYCMDEGLSQTEWVTRWVENDLDLGMSVPDARDRVLTTKREIQSELDDSASALIVTSVVPLLLLTMEAIESSISESRLPVDNTALFEFRWNTSNQVFQLNATPHLPDQLRTRNGFT